MRFAHEGLYEEPIEQLKIADVLEDKYEIERSNKNMEVASKEIGQYEEKID